MRDVLIASVVLAAMASGQGSVTGVSHALPAPLGTFQFNTKGSLWTATVQGHPEWMLGGSLWVNKSSLLVATSPLTRVLGGTPPSILPVAIAAEPAVPAYHGLGADGAWYGQTLPDSPSVPYLQMLGVGTPLAELGHRLTLQVH